MAASVAQRLKISIIATTTLVLTISGGMASLQERAALRRQLDTTAVAVAGRLATTLPTPVWNVDDAQVVNVLMGEMKDPEIEAIQVVGSKGPVAVVERDAQDRPVSRPTPSALGDVVLGTARLIYRDQGSPRELGQAQVALTTRFVRRAFWRSLLLLAAEIVVLDLILILLLTIVVNWTVIRPLWQFRDALRSMTGADAGLDRRLDEHRRDEFGEIARFFNLVTTHFQRIIGTQKELEAELEGSTRQLRLGVQKLERRNFEIAQLQELTEMLTVCQDLGECRGVLASFLDGLFPNCSGHLFLTEPGSGLLTAAAVIGGAPAVGDFPAEICWGIRESKAYVCPAGSGKPMCGHVEREYEGTALCIPIISGGDTHGLLHLRPLPSAPDEEPRFSELTGLATRVAERLALALTTFKLRITLRDQSIHDPLTGLYNRRYLDEVAGRELVNATRRGGALGFIMFDIDHFKDFNDTYGHDAGDVLLRELSQFVTGRLRGGDLAFRIGGEEFLLVLPSADATATLARAETLRQEVAAGLHVKYREALLTVTFSAGVASFPVHGERLSTLLKAADTALYRAKEGGRNRVEAAASPDRGDLFFRGT
jgi:diguanylate cyclase (GGDEF)-like protein